MQQLIKHGMLGDALTEMRPMVDRVCEKRDFMEYYMVGPGKWNASGSALFHGSAGELGTAIKMLHAKLDARASELNPFSPSVLI